MKKERIQIVIIYIVKKDKFSYTQVFLQRIIKGVIK